GGFVCCCEVLMADVMQLLPEADPERDEAIFKQWNKQHKTIPRLAREFNLTQSHVAAIIDQQLPQLTPKAQMRALRKGIFDLEQLIDAYQDVALGEKPDADAANVAIRATHEVMQLRQFLGGGQRVDPIELERRHEAQAGKSSDRLKQMLQLLCTDG